MMSGLKTTLTCAFTQWSWGLGDNFLMGWVIVVVYLIAALASALAARSVPGNEPRLRRERRFWWIAASILLFLAVNKQADLQTLMTQIGRCSAQLSGWYDQRQIVQRDFILAMAVGGVVVLALMALMLRGILGQVWLALLGLGFVCVFVLVRAASFHHVDALLVTGVFGIRMNWLLELPGPVLVALVAFRRRSRSAQA
jgi:hypothetical protein